MAVTTLSKSERDAGCFQDHTGSVAHIVLRLPLADLESVLGHRHRRAGDAIVDVENVYWRLRENRDQPQPRPVPRVIHAASSEVRTK